MSELKTQLLERQRELREELNGVEAALAILDKNNKPQVKRPIIKKSYRNEGTTYWTRRALAELSGGITVKDVAEFAMRNGVKINPYSCNTALTNLKNRGEVKKLERGYALA